MTYVCLVSRLCRLLLQVERYIRAEEPPCNILDILFGLLDSVWRGQDDEPAVRLLPILPDIRPYMPMEFLDEKKLTLI